MWCLITFSANVLLNLKRNNWFDCSCSMTYFSKLHLFFHYYPLCSFFPKFLKLTTRNWPVRQGIVPGKYLWMPNVHSRINNSPLLHRRSESYGVCVCGWKWSQSWRVDLLMKRREPPRASLFGVNNPLNVRLNAIEFQMGWFNYSGHLPIPLFVWKRYIWPWSWRGAR